MMGNLLFYRWFCVGALPLLCAGIMATMVWLAADKLHQQTTNTALAQAQRVVDNHQRQMDASQQLVFRLQAFNRQAAATLLATTKTAATVQFGPWIHEHSVDIRQGDATWQLPFAEALQVLVTLINLPQVVVHDFTLHHQATMVDLHVLFQQLRPPQTP